MRVVLTKLTAFTFELCLDLLTRQNDSPAGRQMEKEFPSAGSTAPEAGLQLQLGARSLTGWQGHNVLTLTPAPQGLHSPEVETGN